MVGLPVANKKITNPYSEFAPHYNLRNYDFLPTYRFYLKLTCLFQVFLYKGRFSAVFSQADTGVPVSELLKASLRQESILAQHLGKWQ